MPFHHHYIYQGDDERSFDGDNGQFTCQECRKVWIKEKIFRKGLENPFELWKLLHYIDLNYGKEIIKVSEGNFTVTLNLLELRIFELKRVSCRSVL